LLDSLLQEVKMNITISRIDEDMDSILICPWAIDKNLIRLKQRLSVFVL